MKRILFTFLFMCLGTAVFAQIPVTFQVDMGAQTHNKFFHPGTDSMLVRGSFQEDAGDTSVWYGSMFKLSDEDGDTVYTLTVDFPADSAGKTYEYKFVKNNDGWEGNVGQGKSNREFTLTGPTQILPKVFYNNDSTYLSVLDTVTNTINFIADLSSILGVGAGGAFDPNQDSILVLGLDWDGLGQGLVGQRRMTQDPFSPGIYRTTLSITKVIADSTKWKFRAFPSSRFSNDGWEQGSDNWFYYGENGDTVDIEAVPRITPVYEPTQNDVEFIFRVDVSNAKNRYNNQTVDPASIEFVGLRGGTTWLGSWASGGWLPSDTISGNMRVLNDNGVNGDLTANDNIWSISITVPSGTVGGAFEYKYCVMYPGADTVNGGSSPLDNEGGFGMNHRLILRDGGPFILNNIFGDFTPTSVRSIDNGILPAKYSIEQNYPNPFNPSTKIRYSIPLEGLVSIKLYNIMGEFVGNIISEQQKAGSYEVEFNAQNLASGVYFYTITSGSFNATKKMMLLK